MIVDVKAKVFCKLIDIDTKEAHVIQVGNYLNRIMMTVNYFIKPAFNFCHSLTQ
jgi:hypothetical protein